MSREVDQRIVEMRFDNSNFEKNAKVTMDTLDEFNSKLEFKNAGKGLEALEEAGKKVSLNPLADAAEKVEVKFSAMSVAAITAIQNIVNKAMDAGEKLVKSLSVDQVTAGWDKYAEKTSAVQTIMAATRTAYGDTEQQMADVNAQLEKLNWFTDETSYSFLDMVSNIGKFTSNNIGLEESVTAMQGISTWAAVSGANVQEAGRTMYNLSQAIGVGAVTAIDWKSIENANMATAEFKQQAIEAGVALGYLKEKGDGTIETFDGNTVSVENFRETLKDKWFNKEVLVTVLEEYGGFADKLKEISDATNLTATDLLKGIEAYKSGEEEFAKYLKDTEVPAQELTEYIKELSSEEYDLGYRSFKAAQEAKTFKEALDAVKDAVSTGWMNTFETIFGDYEHARKLWTAVAEELYDVFVEPVNARNEMLKEWATDYGGRDMMLEGIKNSWESLKAIIEAVNEVVKEVFPPMTAERLADLTKKFKDFSEAHKLDADKLTGFKNVLRTVLTLIKKVGSAVKTAINWFKKLLTPVANLVKEFFNLAQNGNPIEELFRRIFGDDKYVRAAEAMKTIGKKLADAFGLIRDELSKLFGKIETSPAMSKLQGWLSGLKDSITENIVRALESVAEFDFEAMAQTAINALSSVVDYISTHSIKDILEGGWKWIKDTWDELMGMLNGAGGEESEDGAKTGFAKFIEDLQNALDNAKPIIDNFVDTLKNLTKNITAPKVLLFAFGTSLVIMFLSIAEACRNLGDAAWSIEKTFSTIRGKLRMGWIPKLASSIMTLTVALVVLSRIDKDALIRAGIAMGAMAGGLSAMYIAMAVLTKDKGLISEASSKRMVDSAKVMVIFAAGILVLAGALKIISTIDTEHIGEQLLAFAGLLAEYVAATIIISRLAPILTINAGALVAMGLGVITLAYALKILSKIPVETLTSSIDSLTVVVMAMIGLGMAAGNSTFGGAAGITIMALNLLLMVKVMEKLADARLSELLTAVPQLLTLLGMISLMGIAARIAGKDCIKAAGLIGSIAGSLLLMTLVIKILGMMDTQEINQGLRAVEELLGCFALIALLSKDFEAGKFAGVTSGKTGKAILSMAIAILLLTLPINILGGMDREKVIQGGVAVAGLFAVFGLVVKLGQVGKDTKSAATAILAMTVLVGIVSAALAFLSIQPTEGLIVATATLSTALLSFAGTTRLMKTIDWKTGIQNALLMAAMFGAIGMVVWFLQSQNGFDASTVIPIVEGLSIAIGTFTGVVVALGAISKIAGPDSIHNMLDPLVHTILIISALVAGFGLVASLDNNLENLKRGVEVMTTITGSEMLVALGSFTLLTAALGAIGRYAGFKDTLLALVDYAAIVGGVVIIMGWIGSMENDKLAHISQGVRVMEMLTTPEMLKALGAFTLLDGALSAIGKFTGLKAGLAGILDFTAVIVLVAGIVTALGWLYNLCEEKTISDILDDGVRVFEQIGAAIGGFVGNVVGGLIGGIATGALPVIGDNLIAFSEKMGTFADKMAGINPAVTVGAKNIADAILSLTSANIVDSLFGWLAGDRSMTTLSETLGYFGDGIAAFGDAVSVATLNPYQIKAAAEAAKYLSEASATIPKENGLWQWITGQPGDIKKFADGIAPLGTAIVTFSNAVSAGFDLPKIKDSVPAVQSLADMANIIPKQGGLVQLLIGNPGNMANFSAGIRMLGVALVSYSTAITSNGGIDVDAIKASASAAGSLTEVFDALQRTDGWAQTIFGKPGEMADFVAAIALLASGMTSYSQKVQGLDVDSIQASATAAGYLVDIVNALPQTGGLKQFIIGHPEELEQFCSGLDKLGPAMFRYNAFVAKVDAKKISDSADSAKKLAEVATTLPEVSDLKKTIFGQPEGLDTFSIGIIAMGNALATYYASLRDTGVNWVVVDTSFDYIRDFITLTGELTGINTTAVTNFSSSMQTLGKVGYTTFTESFTTKAFELQSIGGNLVQWVTEGVSIKIHSTSNPVVSAGNEVVRQFIGAFTAVSTRNSAYEAGKNLVDWVKNGVNDRNGYNDMYAAGEHIAEGLKNGIRSERSMKWVWNAAWDLASRAVESANKRLNEHSPSKVFMGIGEYCVEGFAIGLTSNMNEVSDSAELMAKNAITETQKMLSYLDDTDTSYSFEPVVRPVLDLSAMEADARNITGTMLGLGSFDFVDRANVAMHSSVDFDQNEAVANAISQLGRQMDSSVNAMNGTINNSLPKVIANSVADALSNVGVYMGRDKVGELVTEYQNSMKRRGGF